jgi:hypothetical protein
MSQPRTRLYPDETPTRAAIDELVSAQSALNMEPSPMAYPEGPYLSDQDKWAADAYQHICAAIKILAGRIS